MSTRERRVTAAMKHYLDKSADMKVEIEQLELLMDPEDSEVCLWCSVSQRRREAAGFSRSSVRKKKRNHFVASKTVGWSTKERGSRSKRGRKASGKT